MQAFATKEQYDARFPGRECTDAVLDECLMEATYAITVVLDTYDVDYSNPDEDMAYRLMSVCRSAANRIIPSSGLPPAGATSYTQTAGPYSASWNLASGYGTPKLLPSELKMLGIGGGRVGWAPIGGRDD